MQRSQKNQLLANEIMQTTRSAGPKRKLRARNNDGQWPVVAVLVILALLYFGWRMV